MLITETGTYNDQFRRPYQSHMTAGVLNQVIENVNRSKSITPSLFSGLTSQIVAPSAQYESQIYIPEGFGERRFKFILHLLVEYKTGGLIEEVVTGWSETPANTISFQNTLDPKTVFRVNNTVHIKTQRVMTPMGVQSLNNISDCSHVLINDHWTGINGTNKDYLLRPTDIFSRTLSSGVESTLSEEGSTDASTMLMNVATKSNRANTVSTNYLSSIIKNYSNAYAQYGVTNDAVGDADALGTAQQYSRENPAPRDPFLETIASMSGLVVSSQFTLNDIYRLDPGCDSRIIYVKKGAAETSKMHHAGQTQGWGGSDLHTHVANLLSTQVPSIMMSHMIMRLAFVSGNLDLTGQVDTKIADVAGFAEGMDMSPYIRSFISKFENEILRDIIDNYQISIGIQMQVDLIGETWISLFINGEKIDYVVPSFADALFVPVVTNSYSTGQQLAQDLKGLMDNIVDYRAPAGFSSNPNDSNPNRIEPQLSYHSLL